MTELKKYSGVGQNEKQIKKKYFFLIQEEQRKTERFSNMTEEK